MACRNTTTNILYLNSNLEYTELTLSASGTFSQLSSSSIASNLESAVNSTSISSYKIQMDSFYNRIMFYKLNSRGIIYFNAYNLKMSFINLIAPGPYYTMQMGSYFMLAISSTQINVHNRTSYSYIGKITTNSRSEYF